VKNLEDTTKCTFTDTASLNATLQQSIKDACEYGLFKGNRGKFSPTESLTRAQTLAVLSRIAGANIIEGNPRRKGYYDFAVQKKRYLPQTGESMEWNITKENFVKLLYSFDTLTSPTSPHPEGTTSGTQTSLIPLTNTSRILEEVDGTPVSGEYTLTFSGSAMNTKFCNGIGGTYSISGNTIQGSFVSTQMLCLDKEKNNFEQLFQLSGANFSIITTTGEKAGSEHLILTTSDKHTFKYLKKNPTIGGQTDEHGCYLGAGYRRNEKAQECQRPWEQTTT
jgi:heat shock protein HslJ